ncbi:tautomerase family protein [Tumebacillus sp. ITR2]|uniref:Tautomerase family protein n=1 Tax=Tumebacillus amylolyticus TaxID=2801339 RepID=A0ABS1JC56_9BACL|nr:tautomerase family protein [Tumebacillus amylolyticus]MBL0387619.1 tautomerase family protein [Tumebacillus amylolyticus]
MPFLSVDTWSGLSVETKKAFLYQATRRTSELLNIPPDKIQVLIRESASENWSKAGAHVTDSDFAAKTRLTDWNTSYDDGQSPISNMTVITIDVWNFYNQEQKDAWVRELTILSGELLGTPADSVLILIRDMVPGNWGQTGVTGASSNFLTDSRRLNVDFSVKS